MRNHTSDREKPRESSGDKKVRLQNLQSKINFDKFKKESKLDPDLIDFSFNSNSTKRNTFSRKRRQSMGVFKNKESQIDKEKLVIFEKNEKFLKDRFTQLKKNNNLKDLLLLVDDFSKHAKGSGTERLLIRYIGETFFAKKTVGNISKCTTDLKARGTFVPKI